MMSTLLGIIMYGIVTMPVNVEKAIFVEKVENKVQIGALAGNRNLEFGLKNILEEFNFNFAIRENFISMNNSY